MKKIFLLIFSFVSYQAFSQCGFTINPSATDVTCQGGNDGIITANPSGGGLPYSFSLNGGAPQSTNSFNGLTEGVYTLYMTDATPCTDSVVVTIAYINGNGTLALTSTTGTDAQIVCSGNSLNNIIYTIGGSATNATVIGLPPGVTSSYSAGSVIISGFTGIYGMFTYTVTATGMCASITATGTMQFIPLQPATFSYPMNTYCQSGMNAVPTGIVTPGGIFSASPVGLDIAPLTGIINLASSMVGTYTVKYIAPGPCNDSSTQNITITSPPNANFVYGGSSPYCQGTIDSFPTFISFGSPGVFSVTPSGIAIDMYTGKIDVFTIIAGTYTVTNFIAAAGGCASTSHSEIITIDSTTVLLDPPDQYICAGINTSAINFVATIPGTTFYWTCNNPTIGLASNGIGNIPSFVALNAGSIATITVIPIGPAPNFCNGIPQSFTITINPSLSYPPFSPCQGIVSPVTCLTGGVFSSIPGLVINSVTGEIDIAASTIGGYTVTYITTAPIPDTSYCSINIVAPPLPDITYGSSSFCQNGNPFTTLTPSCVNPGCYFGVLTSVPVGLVFSPVGFIQLNASAPGTYTITNTYPASGTCPAVSASTIITIYPAITFASSAITNSCNCNGSITLGSMTGTPPFAYNVLPSGTLVSGTISNLCAGSYTLNVLDAQGCTGSVINNVSGTINTIAQINPSCNGSSDGSISVSDGSINSPYTFVLNPGNVIINTSSPTATYSNLQANTYTITATDALSNTCTNQVTLTDPPLLAVVVSSTPSVCGANGIIICSATGGSGPISFTISPFTSTNTTGVFGALSSGTYTITATNTVGCTTSTTISVIGSALLSGITVSDSIYDETCYYAGDGAIDITPNPSSGLFYLWSNGDTTQDLANIVSGTYTVTISNGSGDCFYFIDSVTNIGMNCGSISGKVYADTNHDCVLNAGDIPLQNIKLQLSNGALAYTNFSGDYVFNNVPYGNHTISQILPSYIFPNGCIQPSSLSISSGLSNVSGVDFKDSTINAVDLELYMYSTRYVPGGSYSNIKIYPSNNTSDTVNAIVTFVLNDSLIYNYANPTPSNVTSTPNGDSLTWIIAIPPGPWYTWCILPSPIQVFVNTPATYPMGLYMQSCGSVFPVLGADSNLLNNYYCVNKFTSTSYDPNDKSVSPEGVGSNGGITTNDSVLDYMVRFQNTGTAEAMNIKIMDTLSPNVTINTFEVLASSHNYMVEVLNGNILQFKFNQINLPDSNVNEPLSHGFIAYRVHQKAGNVVGDEIKNTASIYFDFNPPVVTNTTLNTIISPNLIQDVHKNNSVQVYPSPANDELTILFESAVNNEMQIDLINSVGKNVKTWVVKKGTGQLYKLHIHDLPAGYYVLKVTSKNEVQTQKIMIAR